MHELDKDKNLNSASKLGERIDIQPYYKVQFESINCQRPNSNRSERDDSKINVSVDDSFQKVEATSDQISEEGKENDLVMEGEQDGELLA